MQNDFGRLQGNIAALSNSDRETLEEKVIPNAVRWMRAYGEGTSLWEHGRATLEYWGRFGSQRRSE